MTRPTRGLAGSGTHLLAVEIYRRHHDAGTGLCATCGNPMPCAPQRHALSVLHAAGDDPAAHQAPDRPDPRGHHPEPPDAPVDRIRDEPDGFYVNGRTRALNPAGFGYERESS